MIDWGQLDGLRADMGDAFDELVEVFLAEMDEALERLGSTDAAGMAAELHYLKGAALSLGFAAFAALCAEGEQRAAAGGSVDAAPVCALYRQSRAAFLEGLGKRDVA